jgi:protein-disulfide isomerase
VSTLYATLWLITSSYASPLGFYGSVDACNTAAGQISLPAMAQVVCVPSEVAMPLALGSGAQPPAAMAPTATAAPPAPPHVDSSKVSAEGVPFVGDPQAPVTMAYWFDYQCPFCQQVEETVVGRLMSDYVQTGKLKILFKSFAFLGPDSLTAALASDAVWETAPDKFYQWHKAMFDAQGAENSGWATKDKIIALTKTVPGIDAAKVEQFMTDHAGQYQKAIDADAAEGSAMGVNGTPGAIIGKQLIVGAQGYEQFKADIDAALVPK